MGPNLTAAEGFFLSICARMFVIARPATVCGLVGAKTARPGMDELFFVIQQLRGPHAHRWQMRGKENG